MKNSIRLLSLILVVTTLSGAEEAPEKFDTLTTTEGKLYKEVTIREVTPSGVRIMHDSGAATIPFEKLPKDLQQKFGGFDPEAATVHRAEVERKHRIAEAAIAREEAIAIKRDAHEKAQNIEKERVKKLKSKKQSFGVEVVQVLPTGVLADRLETTTFATGSARYGGGGGGVRISVNPTGKIIYIQGLLGMAEQQRAAIEAVPDGTYNYTDTDSTSRTVERWLLVKRNDSISE